MTTEPEAAAARPVRDGAGTTRTGGLGRGLLRLARPKQWVKNVLVFAAPGAAGVLDRPDQLLDALIAFLALCLATSGTYFLNDAFDMESDRAHPSKRSRPIAAGLVPPRLAHAIGAVLILAGVGVGFLTGRPALPLAVAGYLALTTAYTLWLRDVAVADLVAVSSGFVLRTVVGAVATDVPISNWFFIVASFGSLFVVAGKRYAELVELGESAARTRATLVHYSHAYLNYLRAVSSGIVMVAYSLWAFEKAHAAGGGFPWFQLSILPFVAAVLRYALLVEAGKGGAPEDVFISDRPLLFTAAAWTATFAAGIYVLGR